MEALNRETVTNGILEDVIDDLVKPKGKRGVPVLVAKGTLPKMGNEATVEYFFETAPKPKVMVEKDGRVDFRESSIIQQVEAGQLLAVKTPPLPGESGITVTGAPISGKIGMDVPLLRGTGTRFEDPDKLRLVAEISGSAKLRGNGEVEVSERHVIDGDVDFETGNIRFNGTVIIKGNVLSGFEVVATGDVEVNGIIEDATIHCGGNLLVRGGFIGQGKGIARVFGETHIKFLENQTVHGNGDVYIAEEIIHAHVISGGKVLVKFGKGAVIGGTIVAREGVQAKIIGNIHYIHTKVRAGIDPGLDEHIKKLDTIVENKGLVKTRVQEAINKYVEMKYTGEHGGLTPEQDEHLKYLYHVMAHFDEWSEFLVAKHNDLVQERNRLDKHAYVTADQRAFPGVHVSVGELQRKLDKDFNAVSFRIKDRVLTALRPIGDEFKPYEGEGK